MLSKIVEWCIWSLHNDLLKQQAIWNLSCKSLFFSLILYVTYMTTPFALYINTDTNTTEQNIEVWMLIYYSQLCRIHLLSKQSRQFLTRDLTHTCFHPPSLRSLSLSLSLSFLSLSHSCWFTNTQHDRIYRLFHSDRFNTHNIRYFYYLTNTLFRLISSSPVSFPHSLPFPSLRNSSHNI